MQGPVCPEPCRRAWSRQRECESEPYDPQSGRMHKHGTCCCPRDAGNAPSRPKCSWRTQSTGLVTGQSHPSATDGRGSVGGSKPGQSASPGGPGASRRPYRHRSPTNRVSLRTAGRATDSCRSEDLGPTREPTTSASAAAGGSGRAVSLVSRRRRVVRRSVRHAPRGIGRRWTLI
jgi:hypothetical protein